jgi:hypothetical protein
MGAERRSSTSAPFANWRKEVAMKPNDIAQLLDAIAREAIPDEIDLLPRIQGRLNERGTLMQTLRARPALIVLMLLLALALLSGVAYALGRSLGYIPGVGLVDQSVPVRMLPEPVSLGRDGITLTVKQAVLAADKTVVLFTLEGTLQEGAFSHEENVPGCDGMVYLRLPDGSTLTVTNGGGTIHESRFVFPPIPADVNDVTFVMPCILGALPGKAPENWELPLHFVPAPELPTAEVIDVPLTTPLPIYGNLQSSPEMPQTRSQTPGVVSAEKVVKVTTSETPKSVVSDFIYGQLQTQAPGTPEAGSQTFALEQPLQLKQVIVTQGGYIFLLTFKDLYQADGSRITAFTSELTVTDANGEKLFLSYANDIDLGEVAEGADMVWAYRLPSENPAWPLKFQVETSRITTVEGQATFTFNTGEDPQPNQEWVLNREMQIGRYSLRLVSVQFHGTGYSFMFETAPEVDDVALEILGATPIGGGRGFDEQGHVSKSLDFADPVPTGEMTVVITAITTRRPGPVYMVSWQPDNLGENSTSLYGISLVLDRVISTGDGYYLVGHTEWNDERVREALPETMKAFDSNGEELPIHKVNESEISLTLHEHQWLYYLEGKPLGDVILQATQMEVSWKVPIVFTFDMRPYGLNLTDGNLGVPYKIGLKPLDVPELSVQVFTVTYIKEGESYGLEIACQADTALRGLYFYIAGRLEAEGSARTAGESLSYREESGLLISRATVDAPMAFPIELRAERALIGGNWELKVKVDSNSSD